VGKLEVWGRKSPSRVQGWSPAGGLGVNPQKPTTGCENNA